MPSPLLLSSFLSPTPAKEGGVGIHEKKGLFRLHGKHSEVFSVPPLARRQSLSAVYHAIHPFFFFPPLGIGPEVKEIEKERNKRGRGGRRRYFPICGYKRRGKEARLELRHRKVVRLLWSTFRKFTPQASKLVTDFAINRTI